MSFDDRELNLPKWARELLADLRLRLTAQSEPLIKELRQLRPQVEVLKRRNQALTDLLECAARGDHKMAAEIVQVIHDYDLELVKHED